MKRIPSRLALWLLLAGAACRAQGGTDSIIWMVSNFPPVTIVEGTLAGQGYVDRWMALIEERLPQHQYQRLTATAQRTVVEMQARPNVCSPAFLRTPEREAQFVFSRPYLALLPNGMVTTRDKLDSLKPFLDPSGQLRLDALLAAGQFRVASLTARSYGPAIDQALAAHENAVVQLRMVKTFSTSLKAMASQRADFDGYLGYAIEFEYQRRLADVDTGLFAFLPIAGQPRFTSAHVACSRSAAGEAFIRQVDRLIAEPALREQAASLYRAWLPQSVARQWDSLRTRR